MSLPAPEGCLDFAEVDLPVQPAQSDSIWFSCRNSVTMPGRSWTGGELKNGLQAGRGSWQKRGDRIGVILALVC